jgi:hypothetical protein
MSRTSRGTKVPPSWIDTVQFPTKGVRIKASAALVEDEKTAHEYELMITQRYIADKKRAEDYVKSRESKSNRLAIVLTAEKVSNWDFTKDPKEKEFFKDSPVYSLNH